jgi:hypothetical protein
LDTIDSQLVKDGPELADYIRAQMARCTQLLAIISQLTQQSWWVPWEIGVATEKERPLASFVSEQAKLPSYLQKWPYLRTLDDVDKYAEVSKQIRTTLNESVRMRTKTETAARASAFRDFHRVLKSRLGQF